MFAESFKKRYEDSIKKDYKFFYDNIDSYGDYKNSKYALYFVPGINGAPGQVRFSFPALSKIYNDTFYVKALHLPEFCVNKPVWDKYRESHIERRLEVLLNDLQFLADNFDQFIVVCSSNGFYDFMAIYSELSQEIKDKIVLSWVACAPDSFNQTKWHRFFYRINGFSDDQGYEWVAFPNHNMLKAFNPETNTHFVWDANEMRKKLFKHDLESRFLYKGIYWTYASISCFNNMLEMRKKRITQRIDIPVYTLVASNDGYWNDQDTEQIKKFVENYVETPYIHYDDRSHLWVVTPENLYNLIYWSIENGHLKLKESN